MSTYTFSFNYHDYPVYVKVTHYCKGTNYAITSASLDDNDPEELEYELYDEWGNRQTYMESVLCESVVYNAHRDYLESKPYNAVGYDEV